MTTTPRTASTSDARKRQAEKDAVHNHGPHEGRGLDCGEVRQSDGSLKGHCMPADEPPSLPDTSEGIQMSPEEVDALPVGTVLVWPHNGGTWRHDLASEHSSQGWSAPGVTGGWSSSHVASMPVLVLWTPPPVPREPWRVISTDRDQPTLAKVRLDFGDHGETVVGAFHEADGYLCFYSERYADIATVAHVELLHTHDPVTHVPVERALIDEAARREACMPGGAGDHRGHDHRNALEIARALAALADGAQS